MLVAGDFLGDSTSIINLRITSVDRNLRYLNYLLKTGSGRYTLYLPLVAGGDRHGKEKDKRERGGDRYPCGHV